MVWKADRHSSHQEAAKIAPYIVPYTRGRGLDVGSGPNRTFPHFITVDNGKDFGKKKVADIHAEGDKLDMFAEGSLDFVFSSHFLEHVVDYKACLLEWWRVLKVGGFLVLYLPHANFYPNIGQPGANPDHKHDFHPYTIIKAMDGVALKSGQGWNLRECEDRCEEDDDEYSMFLVFEKRSNSTVNKRDYLWQRNPDGKPRALVIRYGAFGDAIMASSILPHLKAQGFHVTLNVSERGYEVLRHDPHIDEFLLQDTDQVPPAALGPYTLEISKRYDRVINLSESIEQAVLTHPQHAQFFYPEDSRRRLFGHVNYLERTHEIAGVPHDYQPRFYKTREEEGKITTLLNTLGVIGEDDDPPVLLFVLAGSAVHKTWPYCDTTIAWLLAKTNARVITVGEENCQLIEQAIGMTVMKSTRLGCPEEFGELPTAEIQKQVNQRIGAQRLALLSGKMTIRETMALAQASTIVIGPETGVVNAVSHEDVGKVVMLSHSSRDNLVKHWKNTVALNGDVSCYPCHRMHYSHKYCPRDENTHAARCMAKIGPVDVIKAIAELMGEAPAFEDAA
jgi:ADP-heptose:LPS heptosyltransferase/predicted SAM-dependent methyltransferase